MEAGLQAWEIIEGIDISLNSCLLSTAIRVTKPDPPQADSLDPAQLVQGDAGHQSRIVPRAM